MRATAIRRVRNREIWRSERYGITLNWETKAEYETRMDDIDAERWNLSSSGVISLFPLVELSKWTGRKFMGLLFEWRHRAPWSGAVKTRFTWRLDMRDYFISSYNRPFCRLNLSMLLKVHLALRSHSVFLPARETSKFKIPFPTVSRINCF